MVPQSVRVENTSMPVMYTLLTPMTAQREVNVLTDCETFIYAFRLAAKIMIDVLTGGTMKEI